MFDKTLVAASAVAALLASSASAFAMSGIGCPDLPEYYRAVGTIQNGPGSCGMSMEEARRILARQNGPAEAPQYDVVVPRARQR